MGPQEDLATSILRDNYGRILNWKSQSAPTRCISLFWQGLRHIFPIIRESFKAKLGDDTTLNTGWKHGQHEEI